MLLVKITSPIALNSKSDSILPDNPSIRWLRLSTASASPIKGILDYHGQRQSAIAFLLKQNFRFPS
ncbi:hypothetical protein NDI39_14580 [Microcoleus sp. ZQ-A2]|nr:hypothetical protein [Microcoleus sp. FACHB-1]